MRAEDKLKELREQGVTVWSFSRLGSFHNCQYEYYNTYVLKNRGKGNVYTEAGSFVHDFIENTYKGEYLKQNFSEDFIVKMGELELLGIDFPSDDIRKNFIEDVKHYTKNFKLLQGNHLLEKLIVFEIDGHWFQGYIDMTQVVENDEGSKDVNVIDWKTSSKFTGKKLTEAGRQLVMYKLGLEATSKAKINKLMWCMIKYLYVCNVQKNKKVKRKMCSRRKWVKEMKATFEKELLNNGMDDLEVDILLETAVNENNIDNLPQFIKDKYWIEDCYVEYEVDEDKINEFKNYINSTIVEIESKNPNNVEDWKPLDLEKESFYCNHLCGHRSTCKFLQEYKKSLNLTKKEVSLDDLF